MITLHSADSVTERVVNDADKSNIPLPVVVDGFDDFGGIQQLFIEPVKITWDIVREFDKINLIKWQQSHLLHYIS